MNFFSSMGHLKFEFQVACSKHIDGDPNCQALDLNIPGFQRANIFKPALFCSPVYRWKKLKEMPRSENGLEPSNKIYAFWTKLRVSSSILQFRNPDTISCNPVIPRVMFCISPPKPAYLQSRIPSFK